MLAFAAAVLLRLLRQVASSCIPGTDCCFYITHQRNINAFDAEAACRRNNSHLATIHSDGENDLLKRSAKGHRVIEIWIGFKAKSEGSNEFITYDGTLVNYTNWAQNEPNNHLGVAEDCVNMDLRENKASGRNGKWNDKPCSSEANIGGFACRKCGFESSGNRHSTEAFTIPPPLPAGTPLGPPPAPRSPCEPGWLFNHGNECCYNFVSEPNPDAPVAERACMQHQSHLTSIHSEQENKYVKEMFSHKFGGNEIWIGLTARTKGSHEFINFDGTPVSYTNWARGEPNNWSNRPEDCVTLELNNDTGIGRESKWNDKNCTIVGNVAGYVCKKCSYVQFRTVSTTFATTASDPITEDASTTEPTRRPGEQTDSNTIPTTEMATNEPVVDPSQLCTYYSGKDIAPGRDLEALHGKEPEECCELCSVTTGCKAYAWNKFSGGTCWLKGVTEPMLDVDDVLVGILQKEAQTEITNETCLPAPDCTADLQPGYCVNAMAASNNHTRLCSCLEFKEICGKSCCMSDTLNLIDRRIIV